MSNEGAPVLERPLLDIDRYKELVDRCARERLNHVIPNGSPVHARLLISKLFETARKSVVIVSGKLTDLTTKQEDIYGAAEVIAYASQFLSRPDTSLRIVVDEPIHRGTENRFLASVIDNVSRLGTVKVSFAQGNIAQNKSPHFMMTDALAYRYEPFDQGVRGDQKIKATANFGDPGTAKLLNALFNDVESFASFLRVPLSFKPGSVFASA